MPNLTAPRRDCERAADLAHLGLTESTHVATELALLDGLDVIEVDGRVLVRPSFAPMITSLGRPRIVDVTGATIAVRSNGSTS